MSGKQTGGGPNRHAHSAADQADAGTPDARAISALPPAKGAKGGAVQPRDITGDRRAGIADPAVAAPAGPATPVPADRRTVHASAVSVAGRGLLILGASGAGKSALALDLMSRGAVLIADDRVCLTRAGAALIAACPPAISGRIEARGVGILRATPAGPTPLVLVADLDRAEPDRLPPPRHIDLLGIRLPLVLGAGAPHLGAALRQMLLAGRSD